MLALSRHAASLRERAARATADALRSRAAQLRNAEGHALECSHYTPDVWSEPVRCVSLSLWYRPVLRASRDRVARSTRPRRSAGGRRAWRQLRRAGTSESTARATQALPCVIFLHGNSGCRVDAYDAVRVLLPLNITVFALDLSGSGLSGGCVGARVALRPGARRHPRCRYAHAHGRCRAGETRASRAASRGRRHASHMRAQALR